MNKRLKFKQDGSIIIKNIRFLETKPVPLYMAIFYGKYLKNKTHISLTSNFYHG